MPPKAAAEKKPAASKAPAAKAPAEKKEAGKKTAATGEKKKRTKTRKETYSSYIYKGMSPTPKSRLPLRNTDFWRVMVACSANLARPFLQFKVASGFWFKVF